MVYVRGRAMESRRSKLSSSLKCTVIYMFLAMEGTFLRVFVFPTLVFGGLCCNLCIKFTKFVFSQSKALPDLET